MTLRLCVATSNPGKLREFRALLASWPIQINGLDGIDGLGSLDAIDGQARVEFPAEGLDYTANAVAKARAVAQQLGAAAVADDSGLEVDALGGAPGPLSARYGGAALDDAGRVSHLLAALGDVGEAQRGARFVCVAAFALASGEVATARGTCVGRIRRRPSGAGGFGYDPVFEPEGEGGKTMAELPAERKHAISHRGRAVAALTQTQSWSSFVSM